jgi:hypothetical protein
MGFEFCSQKFSNELKRMVYEKGVIKRKYAPPFPSPPKKRNADGRVKKIAKVR